MEDLSGKGTTVGGLSVPPKTKQKQTVSVTHESSSGNGSKTTETKTSHKSKTSLSPLTRTHRTPRANLSSPQPENVPLTDGNSPLDSVQPQVPRPELDIAALTTQILSALSPQLKSEIATVHSDVGTFRAQVSGLSDDRASDVSADQMPPANSLPEMDPAKPWRSVRLAPVVGDTVFLEGLGSRPLADFERFPPGADLPFCYLRLSPDAVQTG